MEEFVKDESAKNLIFTEDLKNMVHLSQIEDCPLLVQMIKRFCSQSKEVRFGNFIFGPVIMRLFYHLQDARTALELFNDESLGGFFDQLITYQILLDMLYEKEKYQEVLDTYDIIRSRQLQGSRYPKHSIIIVFGACYKLNTPESLAYATKVFHGAVESGHIPLRRASTFMALLALNQNEPQVALEVLGNVKGQNYVSVRAIRALALARMKRYDDVLPIIRSLLDGANPMQQKQTIPIDTVKVLQKEFAGNEDKDLQVDFEKVINFLSNHGHIKEETLDQILCSEIQINLELLNRNRDRDDSSGGGNQSRRYNPRQVELDRPSRFYAKRPGLHELN